MTYKIIDIQGIGPVYAEKLIGIGIETVDQLLRRVLTPRAARPSKTPPASIMAASSPGSTMPTSSA